VRTILIEDASTDLITASNNLRAWSLRHPLDHETGSDTSLAGLQLVFRYCREHGPPVVDSIRTGGSGGRRSGNNSPV